jgi:hypothetical protein
VFFTKRKTRELPTFDLYLDGYSIPWSDRAKYLGLILDKKLKFSPHFVYFLDKVQKLTRILYPLINRRSTLSLDQKVLLYKAIFQPTILHPSVVCCGCGGLTNVAFRYCKTRLCLRLILNVPRLYGTSETHERTICKLISENIESHYEKLCRSLLFADLMIYNPLCWHIIPLVFWMNHFWFVVKYCYTKSHQTF